MKVFKFGGASIQTVERIEWVGGILAHYKNEKILVVVSAIGKTTNALEKIVAAFYKGNKEEALELFSQVKNMHNNLAKYLLVKNALATENALQDFYTEIEWLLHDNPVRKYDYYYDQMVCVGELLATTLVSAYLNEIGVTNQWLDVRDIIRTDNQFRQAELNEPVTLAQIQKNLLPQLEKHQMVVTQGFIGATEDNESTTLGREGSDYTGAIFANLLDAESLTIWKDAPGVMSADPKLFADASIIPALDYEEVIEMAFFGAQVIHPKTIKPLQNKRIPLLVKCFLDPNLPGTIIHQTVVKQLQPIIILKKDQVFMQLQTKDFGFVGAQPMADLYKLLVKLQIKANIIQTGAITVQLCMDEQEDKTTLLAVAASEAFTIDIEKGFTLLTIRHYNDAIVAQLLDQKNIQLWQRDKKNMQALYK
jgi:aspartate kinase